MYTEILERSDEEENVKERKGEANEMRGIRTIEENLKG